MLVGELPRRMQPATRQYLALSGQRGRRIGTIDGRAPPNSGTPGRSRTGGHKEAPSPACRRGGWGRGVRRVLPLDVLAEAVPELRLTQLAERLGLDLANPLAAHAELLADLAEGPIAAVLQAEPHPQHLALA